MLRQFYTSYYLSLVVIQDDLFIFSLEDLDTLLDDVVSIMIHYELFYLGLQFLKINSKLTTTSSRRKLAKKEKLNNTSG